MPRDEQKQHEIAEKARNKLTGTTISLDDDLRHMQQHCKDAA